MSVYYHLAGLSLDVGSVFLPGNFGRVLSFLGKNHKLYFREMLLESFRENKFPFLPSRLRSIFYFDNEEAAVLFRKLHRNTDILYKIELLDCAPQMEADWNYVEPLPDEKSSDFAWLERYWTGKVESRMQEYPEIACKECFSESRARIVGRLEV